MRIEIKDFQHKRILSAEVDLDDPPSLVRPVDGGDREVYLHWDQAIDDERHLRRCPVCGCGELFVRKDFPQVTGLLIVVLAAVIALVLFGARQQVWAFTVLGMVALIDTAIFVFAGRCLVCYRCRSEYRDLPIRADHPGWELATGEKYRSK
ncbi:MAG: hypothetical protein CMJ18_05760 [Phycisphaeraceae bacterium]|nr:hypothetical protein [Phycisphaeraceae bacterium]